MTSSRMTILAALALAAVLAGCKERRDPGFQGWVEADLIFVSPDETGRVEKLNVREGDEVKPGAPLFSLDDDLQRADLAENEATLANAQQTFDRAQELSKTGSGSQANLDSATSALRAAEARLNPRRPGWRGARLCAGRRHHPGDLLPRRRDGAGAAADRVDAAAGQREGALLRAASGAAELAHRRRGRGDLRRLRRPTSSRACTSSRRRPSSPRP